MINITKTTPFDSNEIFFYCAAFFCLFLSGSVHATDYTISNGTTQTSRVTLTNNDTLTVDNGGEIDYTWPAVDADNRTFPAGTTTITNNGIIEGNCCVIDIRSSVNPKLINNGTINGKSSSRTIYANNSVNATIINNGDITILGSSNYETIDGDSSSGLTITNNSGATISSEGDDAIDIENASNVTITNAGTISAGDDWGIQADYADGLTINNSGTISAVDDYAIYLRNADNVSITNSGTITSAEDPINMQSSTGTVSITNSGTISQTGGGYNDGLTLQDNATITNTGTISASRYAIGGSSSGVTFVNKGTITGGTYDFYVPSMTITTLTNGQGGSDALVYRGKMPTNYKLFVASTSSYGKFAKEWGTSGTTTFSIDTASTLAANTYTDVFTNTTSSRFAGGLTGTCVCSNGVFTWTLSDANSDNKWDLAIAAD
ncbi:right-handed parallel beta-helix repeat-containing protein, partial [Candidatus Thioglobus sp.]|nr:right-handed parallel beta-helix repeat-containing protein [Candidatus Thioglobus sp.]